MSGTILFVLTSHATFLDGKHPTGYYLAELAHPYAAVTKAGFKVVLASPKGGAAPLDPSSIGAADPESLAFHKDPAMEALVANTKVLAEVNEKDYDAIFYVGGHGPCFDLAVDPVSIALAETFFANGKPLAAVCHGPAAFHAVKDRATGKSVFAGRKATCFSNEEEEMVGLTKAIPFLVESDIVANGGTYVKERAAWGVEVVVDTNGGTLITGANPASATKTGEAIVAALKK